MRRTRLLTRSRSQTCPATVFTSTPRLPASTCAFRTAFLSARLASERAAKSRCKSIEIDQILPIMTRFWLPVVQDVSNARSNQTRRQAGHGRAPRLIFTPPRGVWLYVRRRMACYDSMCVSTTPGR
jgi:hypothetical protein